MKGWRRGAGATVITKLDAQEAGLLRGLVGQVKEMLDDRTGAAPTDELAELTGMQTGPSLPPEDRVLGRLLPDFSRDDSELSSGMRALHEPELLAAKDGVAQVVLQTCPRHGGTVRLDGEQAHAWLAALNDVRLAMGTALEVTEDMPEELPPDDPRADHLAVYHWLSYVQESLVQAVLS